MRQLTLEFLLLINLVLGFVISEQFSFDFDSQDGIEAQTLSSRFKRASDSSLLWGPYRSSLYFGIRPRIPRSLLSGLMWFQVDNYGGIGNLRHFYNQDDNMKRANWITYDPRTGGRQILSDNDNHIDIVTDFVKSDDGYSWGVRIHSTPHPGYENIKISFIWYSGLESEEKIEDGEVSKSGHFRLKNKKNVLGHDSNVTLEGFSEELGIFEMTITDGPIKNRHPKLKLIDPELDPAKSHHFSLVVPNDNVWKAKDIFMTMLQESIQQLVEKYSGLENIPSEQALIIRDLQDFEGNLHFVQKVYEGECQFDILYNNGFTPKSDHITAETIELRINNTIVKLKSKFNKHFQIEPPYSNDEQYTDFAQEIISGLLGGLSYFYGDHIVDRETVFDEELFESYELKGSLEGPHELFSLVPSRPFFPRGFLWDEGFHLLPLLEYDSDLVFEILQSWFSLIDDEGWVAREQILGPELRSRVPAEFQIQSPEIVNPPTLMLVLTYLLDSTKENFGGVNEPIVESDYGSFNPHKDLGLVILQTPDLLANYTQLIYPKLKQYFNRFRASQQGYIEEFDRGDSKEGYRWRGRTLTHCLASGLDDYPRALPADIAELNVDLVSWIGIMTRSMKLISGILGYKEDVKMYLKMETDLIKGLNMHWSNEEGSYCDMSVDDNDENVHVCHKGYISLFPFLTKLIPAQDTSKIELIVDLILDPNGLWSDFGIRSLSKSDKYYRTGENYWRSPIWININYLVLDGLKHYYAASSQYMTDPLKSKMENAYKLLRQNLVDNIFKQWKATGFVWEQYDDETGSPKGAKNFLGWSSLVVLIMCMPEHLNLQHLHRSP
ncbi:uncharacterized protein PRCAT00002356001 [Priceomyces carsonii]|uniref:uncharacterized protein n=1 Tax=Priceomyces carsonii TaxID=28549 RepID=UPI002ED9BB3E|nr:unnamed protein product [Priceomyces carsonii]